MWMPRFSEIDAEDTGVITYKWPEREVLGRFQGLKARA